MLSISPKYWDLLIYMTRDLGLLNGHLHSIYHTNPVK